MQLSKRPAASLAGILCAKERQSRCLLHPDWIHSLQSSNQHGVTAWVRLSFQDVTKGIKHKSFEQRKTIFKEHLETSHKQFRQLATFTLIGFKFVLK